MAAHTHLSLALAALLAAFAAGAQSAAPSAATAPPGGGDPHAVGGQTPTSKQAKPPKLPKLPGYSGENKASPTTQTNPGYVPLPHKEKPTGTADESTTAGEQPASPGADAPEQGH